MRADVEKAVDSNVELAVERTELALERTQLAWVRTLLSMIGGGFIIDKGFEKLHQARIESGEALLRSTHAAGLIVTSIGTLLMVIVTILYFNRSKKLGRMRGNRKTFFAPGFLISAVTVMVGMLLIWIMAISKDG